MEKLGQDLYQGRPSTVWHPKTIWKRTRSASTDLSIMTSIGNISGRSTASLEGVGGSIIKNFDQVFEALQLQQDGGSRDAKVDMGQEVQERLAMIEAGFKVGDEITFQELALSPDEMERFQVLGPITQEEIEETDWDQLADDLTL